MGNHATSPLRRAMGNRDLSAAKQILDDAGQGSGDLIDEDYTSDCMFSCTRNVQNPFHTAMTWSQLSFVEMFLEYGADCNSTGLWEQTGLHRAGRQNNLQLVKLLIKHGAELYVRDSDGRYPVHSAALSGASLSHGNADVLAYYVEELGKPEDITLRDYDDNTPLHAAAWWGNPYTAEWLLQKGADVTARNKKGKTPLDVAHKRCKTILEEHAKTKGVL